MRDGAVPGKPGERWATVAELTGRQYVATAASKHRLVKLPGMYLVHLNFSARTLDGSGVCNEMRSGYTLKSGRLRVTEGSQTAVDCVASGRMEQDAWLGKLLKDGVDATVRTGGDTLTLSTSRESVTLERLGTADGPLPAEGTRWVANGLSSSRDGADPWIDDPEIRPRLRIHAGLARVFTGCNTGTAKAKFNDGLIEFGPLTLTHKRCRGQAKTLEAAAITVFAGRAHATFPIGNSMRLQRTGVELSFRPNR